MKHSEKLLPKLNQRCLLRIFRYIYFRKMQKKIKIDFLKVPKQTNPLKTLRTRILSLFSCKKKFINKVLTFRLRAYLFLMKRLYRLNLEKTGQLMLTTALGCTFYTCSRAGAESVALVQLHSQREQRSRRHVRQEERQSVGFRINKFQEFYI